MGSEMCIRDRLAPFASLRKTLKSTSPPLYLVIKWSASIVLLLLLPLLLALAAGLVLGLFA